MRLPIPSGAALSLLPFLLAAAACGDPGDPVPDGEAPVGDTSAEARAAPARPPVPDADTADVASIDAIIAATYDVISGPAGERRDWERFRSLFIPEARLIAVGRNREGDWVKRVMTPEEYATNAGPQLETDGFFERELSRVEERYRHIAHVFSTYESLRAPGEEPFARGINSFQLLHDGERWWVVTILWNGETAEEPIPERYR